MNSTVTLSGGCHCGDVRYKCTIQKFDGLECNCSVCFKKGFLHTNVPKAQFTLLKGRENLTLYTYGTHNAKHLFCSRCGIHCFYRPRSHPECYSVNLRSLDDTNIYKKFKMVQFDGQNWEENANKIK